MKTEVITTCPHCNKKISVDTPVVSEPIAPDVRSKIKPAGNVLVYRISSEEIKEFIVHKCQQYAKDSTVEVVTLYCEKKKRRDNEPRHSYASLRIAFSEHVLARNKEEYGWYGKIGQSSTNFKFQEDIRKNLIDRWGFNRQQLLDIQKSYKKMEELEEGLGMTEAYLADLTKYSIPQRIKTNDTDSWIFFSAAAERVIENMLEDVHINKLPGRMQIMDVHPISNNIVEFVVYIHPDEVLVKENPHVRQILIGEEKPKK